MSEGVACVGCGKQLSQTETLYAADGRPVCQACADKTDLAATAGAGKWTLAGIGAACGIAPFLFSAASYSVEMENDKVTHFSYHDPIAMGGGAACVIVAILAAVRARRASALGPSIGNKGAILVPILLLLLGAFQIARGFGVFVDPASLH